MDTVFAIERNQQRCQLLHNSGVLQLSPMEGPHAGDFLSQFVGHLPGAIVITANNDVTLNPGLAVQKNRRQILKGSSHGHAFRHQFGRLLGGRPLPDAQCPRRPPAHDGR